MELVRCWCSTPTRFRHYYFRAGRSETPQTSRSLARQRHRAPNVARHSSKVRQLQLQPQSRNVTFRIPDHSPLTLNPRVGVADFSRSPWPTSKKENAWRHRIVTAPQLTDFQRFVDLSALSAGVNAFQLTDLGSHHFMFGPSWEQGCPSCSHCADNFAGYSTKGW